MKKTITHESFPQFVENLENRGTKLHGLEIGRTLASVLNMLISNILMLLVVCVVYCTEDGKGMPVKEAFTHIPSFFHKACQWAMDLLPAGLSKWWICLIFLLLVIPVTGIVAGLIFRWIPFKGKAVKVEGETPVDRTDNAIKLAKTLRSKYLIMIDGLTFGPYVAPVVTGLAALALPIISVCRAGAGLSWYMVLIAVVAMLFQMFFLLAVVLCVLCFAAFGLTFIQEWITGLFYRGVGFKKEMAQLEEYRKFLDQEAEDDHKRFVAKTEAEAVELLINGKLAAALKTLSKIEDEAKDAYYIKEMADMLSKDDPAVWRLKRWLNWSEEDIKSQALQAFLREQQENNRQKLLKIAEEDYPKALESLENEDYKEAIEYLMAAEAVDYRDGVALHALADFHAGRRFAYGTVIKMLTHGIEKGMESEKWEVRCLGTINQAKEAQRREKQEEEERKKAEEAYWLEVGGQANMTCPHEVNGYCCRYTTLDNFPHKCYYIDRRRDMWMCSDRK